MRQLSEVRVRSVAVPGSRGLLVIMCQYVRTCSPPLIRPVREM